jgi:hypothetical protein
VVIGPCVCIADKLMAPFRIAAKTAPPHHYTGADSNLQN